jgi:O-antigen/teichoic acid export membrane protein
MRFAKAFVITLISQAIIVLSGVLNSVIIVRALGPQGQGVYTLIITTSVMLLIFGSAGLVTSNTYWAKKSREEASAIFVNSIIFAMAVSLLAFLCYNLFGKRIMLRFFSPDISLILVISLPMLLIQEFNQGILWGLERYDYHNFLNMFKAASLVVANLILVLVLRLGIKAAALGWLSVISLTSIISTFILWREIGITYLLPKISLLVRSLRIGLRVLLANVVWFLSARIDLYLVAYFLGAKEVGFYSIALLIMQMANIVPTILGKFIFNSSIIDNQKQTLFSSNLIKITLIYSFGFALAISLLGKILIQTFFGEAFIKSFECLIFLLPATVALGLNTSVGYFISGRKAVPIYNICAIVLTLISNIIFNLWLIPTLKINGAAISSSLSQIVHFILLLFILKKLDLKLSIIHPLNLRLQEIVRLVGKSYGLVRK